MGGESARAVAVIGCAVWAHPLWAGTVYPRHARQPLHYYSRQFATVEGNTTFYATPTAKTLRQWAEATPPGFRFCLKLPQTITHKSASLKAAIPEALAFATLVQNLGDRAGPCFAQLPPRYAADQFTDLEAFLQAWPQETVPLALEVRHLSWWQSHQKLHDLLTATGTTRVLLDTRAIYDGSDDPQPGSERRKPQVPLVAEVTTQTAFVRYISHPDRDRNLRYWQEWVEQWRLWQQQGITVYFFVHCPQEQHSPHLAQELHAMLGRVGVELDQLAPEIPNQLDLF